jgi:1-deoxy-D-xylulose-5-phosphate synthase
MRIFPNMVVMAPGDAFDVPRMLDFALSHDGPSAIRYPKASAVDVGGQRSPIELGKAEVLRWGRDGMIVCCGALLSECLSASEMLGGERLDVGVINARFVKPIDRQAILKAVRDCGFLITVEEACLAGGFGSAVLETASDAGLSVEHIHRLGIPDRFVEHAGRGELLCDLGLDADGIARTCRTAAEQIAVQPSTA